MEIFRTDNFYVLLHGESTLWIDRKTGNVDAKPAWELANGYDTECLGIFFGLIGCIKYKSILENTFLLIKEGVLVGELYSGHPVHKIKSIVALQTNSIDDVSFAPCPKHHGFKGSDSSLNKSRSSFTSSDHIQNVSTNDNSPSPRKLERREEKFKRRILLELHRIFTDSDSFYYCPNGGDITNSVYRNHLNVSNSKDSNADLLSQLDDRFFWNKYMLEDVINLNSDMSKIWIMPIIQGYVQIKSCRTTFWGKDQPEDFTISVISRRSRHRVGTRYRCRGIDELGHCANYVETEQIVKYKTHVLSFLQTRGSIPLYWTQEGYKYKPPPQIYKSFEENHAAFCKHMREEINRHGPLIIISLVERTGKEAVVGDAFADHVCAFNSPDLTYVTFDIHHYCRGLHFENVSLLSEQLEEVICKMGYCWLDNEGLISKQKSIFRVNCIDCLDRTNLVQMTIARQMLDIQLIKLGLMTPETPHNLHEITQEMWANNGDAISKQYAGTNALKGDITRTGERHFTGMMKDGMNSANRYYLSRFKDTTRQTALDIMLGQNAACCVVDGKESNSDDSENEEKLMMDEESVSMAERMKNVIEDVKKFVTEDPDSQVVAAWAMIDVTNVDQQQCDVISIEMDTIIVLTRSSYYLVHYDGDLDNVIDYIEIPLKLVKEIEISANYSGTPVKSSSAERKRNIPTLTIAVASPDGFLLKQSFKSINFRFFNNVPIAIKSNEERLESLKAVAETIQATFDISGLDRLPIKINTSSSRRSSLIVADLKAANTQISSLKNAGSKALTNMSQRLSKFNQFGQNFRLKRSSDTPPTKPETATTRGNAEKDYGEGFLPAVGIVSAKTENIPQIVVQDKDGETTTNYSAKSKSSENIQLLSPSGDMSMVERSHSDMNLPATSTSDANSKLKSIKSGLTSVLVNPMTPFSRFAKGVQTIGSNLDPRRLKMLEAKRVSISENVTVRKKWVDSKCVSKLYAL